MKQVFKNNVLGINVQVGFYQHALAKGQTGTDSAEGSSTHCVQDAAVIMSKSFTSASLLLHKYGSFSRFLARFECFTN